MFAVYAAIGVAAVRARVIEQSGLDVLSRYIAKIALPLLVMTNMVNGVSGDDLAASLPLVASGLVMYAVLAAAGYAASRRVGLMGEHARLFVGCTMCGNHVFVGLPIIMALFPARAMGYLGVLTVLDQAIMWTVGVWLTQPEGSRSSPLASLRRMLNPMTVAIAIGAVCMAAGLRFSGPWGTALVRVGSTATPVSMIFLGATFCFIDRTQFAHRREIFLPILIKMIAVPPVLAVLLSLLPGMDRELVLVTSLLCAMPTMVSIAMLAQLHGADYRYTSGLVFVTTAASLVTLPIMSAVLGALVPIFI